MVQRPRRAPYWLLVKNERIGMEVLTTRLSDGQRALLVFSLGEEAEMFLSSRDSRGGSKDDWRVRETMAGELLSILRTILRGIKRVMLDPIPVNSSLNASEMPGVSRKDFMGHLENANGPDDVVGIPVVRVPYFSAGASLRDVP